MKYDPGHAWKNDDLMAKYSSLAPKGSTGDNATVRFHHVGFPLTLSLGSKGGDINATQVK